MDTPEQTKAEAFAEKIVSILNNGALALMTSIGHRTGLFNVMSLMPAASSQDIANQANLNEPYVREWLGAMVTGRIVEYHPEQRTYKLPLAHAAFLTGAASTNILAMETQFFSRLALVEDKIVECFKSGKGVTNTAFPRFHEVMSEETVQTVCSGLLDFVLPMVSGLVERLREGIKIIEVGCGSGSALNLMARTFPNSQFTGYDLSDEAITKAQNRAHEQKLTNIQFQVKEVGTLERLGPFDLVIAFDTLHDQAQPDKVLKIIASSLKPEGTLLMKDIAGSSHLHQNLDHPLGPLRYTLSTMHYVPVWHAQSDKESSGIWGKEKTLEILQDAGFHNVHVQQLPHDLLNYYYICKPV